MNASKKKFTLSSFLLIAPLFVSLGQTQINPRAEWFVDSRFGMFIHWGIYSGAEGVWKGEPLRNDNNYAEWILYRNRIEKNEYLTLLDRFDWDSIDPEEWVILAKKAGMKYVTLTAKHHDGFALWNSKVSDYDIADHTKEKRDIVNELAAACKKHGLKMGLYYSHWVDWEHQYGWDHTKEIYPISQENYDKYWQEKVIPQIRELLTNYGPVSMMWFDMWVHHSETIVSKEELLQLKATIRELQPDCLVNSRLGLSIEEDSDVDFRTLGDNQLGRDKLDYPWQSPATVAHSWGYHALDDEWKSTTTLLGSLINNVSLNGNFMLNIGPKSNGAVPLETTERLTQMGDWLSINGEAIYHCHAFDLPANYHDWGKITCKPMESGRFMTYLHVLRWPYNNMLRLSGVQDAPLKAWILGDKFKTPLEFSHLNGYTEIILPPQGIDALIPIVAVEYAKKPATLEGISARATDGGYQLSSVNIVSESGTKSYVRDSKSGTVPAHIIIDDKYTCTWKIVVSQPGTIRVDASYSQQGSKPAGEISVKVLDITLKQTFQSTGKTVGEPNRKFHIDDFESHTLGTIKIDAAGIYEISMDVKAAKDNPIQLQWLWVQPE